jgi:YVTN family beta-propeller protein
MSPSGDYIYMVKSDNTVESTDTFVAAFDTRNGEVLPAHVSLYGCNALVLPTSIDLTLDIACSNTAYVRELVLGTTEDAVSNRLFTSQAVEPRSRWSAVFITDSTIGLIDNNASNYLIDRPSGKFRKVSASASIGRRLGLQRALIDPTEGNIYFGSREGSGPNSFGLYNEVVKADSSTLVPEVTRSTAVSFYSMTLSRDGSTVYTVSPDHASVTIIDAISLQELRQVSVGTKPIFAVAAP